jgi:hypothetical protein
VNFVRVNGDINSSPPVIAEVINYTPDMVVGGPFFTPTPAGGSTSLKVQSLISLPPVF